MQRQDSDTSLKMSEDKRSTTKYEERERRRLLDKQQYKLKEEAYRIEPTIRRAERAKITSCRAKAAKAVGKSFRLRGTRRRNERPPGEEERERARTREKGRRRVSKKFGVIAAAELVSVFPASYPLPQPVRDCPRSGIKRRTIDGDCEGNERELSRGKGREGNLRVGRKSREKEEVANRRRRTGRKRGTGDPKLFGVIAVRSRFSRSCPFTTFSSSSPRLFLFLLLPLPF